MKLTCSAEDLGKGLKAVKSAVYGRSAVPALRCVRLDAVDGLLLSATDLEIGVRRRVEASVQEGGVALVPHALFSGVVSSLDGELSLRAEGESLRLECGRQKSRFATEDILEFPEMFKDVTGGIVLDGLKDMVGKVAFSAATDGARPALEAVLVKSGETFRMVTADGYRLSIVESEARGEVFTALVPVKAMKEVAKLDGDVTFNVTSGQAVFTGDGTEIVSQLIDGKFPKYREIVPKLRAVRVTVDADVFGDALKVVLPFAELVRVSVGDGVKLSARGEMGDGVAEFDADVDGEPVEFAVNGKYLSEALGVMEAVTMDVSGPDRPILFMDGGFTHVLMPMRTND